MLSRSIFRLFAISLPATLAAAASLGGACYGSSPSLHGKPARSSLVLHRRSAKAPTTRSSVDPPIASQGKLGQDLFLAIDHGSLKTVRALLKRGADPNSRNGLLFTPLDLAAASGQTAVMEALLKAGAQLDATSPYGTPLLFASVSGIPPAMEYLISRGANVNASREDGINVLMMAARAGYPPMVTELLRRKANVNAADDDGATPLIFAARAGQVEAGRVLLAAGANVDGADRHGWTPLMYAAVGGNTAFVRLLLGKGATLDAREKEGRTPLLLAAAYGDNPEVIDALKQGGADVHAVDARRRTALMLTASRGHFDCARLLGDPGSLVVETHRTPRAAVQASVKVLEQAIRNFDQEAGCISCHQEGLGRITTAAVAERGFSLDPAVDRAQVERINGAVNQLAPLHMRALKDPAAMKNVPLIEIEEVADGYSYMLAGMAAHNEPRTRAAGAMAMVLARQQLPAGNWRFGFPRVPLQSSYFTFTALSIHGLQAYGPKANAAEIAGRVHRARRWLLTTPATATEDLTFRLLGLKWAGATAGQKQSAAGALKSAQRPDGGWSQLPTLHSDAYATGEALYALHVAGGLPVTAPTYQRGVQFLLRTQDDDGSWFVRKRADPVNNYLDAGFPHGEAQYSSFDGTCWATLALLQAVEPVERQASLPRP